jgi:membrane associated rhomboid family serine protease
MPLPQTDDAHPTRTTPAVSALIAALIAGFVVRFGLVGDATSHFVGFAPDAVAERWWTAVTYPFATPRPLVLAVDLVALWAFGPRLEEAWGTRRFLGFALLCTLGGALLHFLVGDAGDPLLGPTAAVFGLMVAHVRLWRDAEVWLFGVTPISARAVAAALALSAVVAGLGAADTYMGEPQLSTLSHLGGAAMAFLYLRVPQRERIEQLRQRISPVPDVSEDIARPIPRTPPRPRERPEEIDEIVARSKAVVARRRDPAPRVRRSAPERKPPADELDRVLDKISAQGMASLSSEEKEILERNARRLKGQ